MKRKEDDWGPALGADEKSPELPPTHQGNIGLVRYFRDILPRDSWGLLNAPVNSAAMMKRIKDMREQGYSHEQIREMMDIYVTDISRRPLPADVAPWRGFLANLDGLAARLSTKEESYDDVQVDGGRFS